MLPALLLATLALAEDAAPFTCCDDPVVERVVEVWLDTSEALHHGRDHREGMKELADAARVRASSNDAANLEAIAKEATSLSSLSLSEARARVQPLAREVLWLALRHESGSLRVVQGFCAGQGSWVQRKGKRARNPSGSTCGVLR